MISKTHRLTCNGATDPLGLDSLPAFSWQYRLGGDNHQRAYRIAVASTAADLAAGNYDCWNF